MAGLLEVQLRTAHIGGPRQARGVQPAAGRQNQDRGRADEADPGSERGERGAAGPDQHQIGLDLGQAVELARGEQPGAGDDQRDCAMAWRARRAFGGGRVVSLVTE